MGCWHIAFAVVPAPITAPGAGGVAGVDRGVRAPAALSTGEMTSPKGLRAKEAERLLALQRRLTRASGGSTPRKQSRTLTGRLKARDGDRRKDWVKRTTTDLAGRFDVVRVESLNVKAMTGSARGTVQKPGRNLAQKAGLNRGILKSGWGTRGPVGTESTRTSQEPQPWVHVADLQPLHAHRIRQSWQPGDFRVRFLRAPGERRHAT